MTDECDDDPWRMASGHVADAVAGAFGLWLQLRRRTTDGYTRVEVSTSAGVRRESDGGARFTVYLTDDERRRLAAALLEGLS
jgi:hypothetical protein